MAIASSPIFGVFQHDNEALIRPETRRDSSFKTSRRYGDITAVRRDMIGPQMVAQDSESEWFEREFP